MNPYTFEKISGINAIKRLVSGEAVYSKDGERHKVDDYYLKLYFIPKGFHHENLSLLTFNEIAEMEWYIPKPFDVRQAMRDKPDEWVGAYKNFEGKWFKVGFDTASMNAVVEQIEWDGNPFWQHGRARPSVLNECIPIEDVPEEATR